MASDNIKVKFLSLQKPELAYEVAVRGETPADTVEALWKQIVKLTLAFPSEDILESPFDALKDIDGINESLQKLETYLISLQNKYDANLLARAQNLFNHIVLRTNRVDSFENIETLTLLNLVRNRTQAASVQLNEINSPESQPDTNANLPLGLTQISVTCDRGLTSDFSKLKFNGKGCPRAFITKVNEFIEARNIPSNKILAFGTEIFCDDALHWFRSIKTEISTWQELSDRIREDFSVSDYDYRFISEIRSRTQGEKENITVYLSIMKGMFSQLTKTLSEEDQLEIILHNVRPCYASVLSSCSNIKTIDQLQTICKNFENIQARLCSFHEPPRVTSNTLAPEFAYAHFSNSQSSAPYKTFNNNKYDYPRNTQPVKELKIEEETKPVLAVNTLFCVRCRTEGHSLRSCNAERFLICFGCGLKGVSRPNCPECRKKSNALNMQKN